MMIGVLLWFDVTPPLAAQEEYRLTSTTFHLEQQPRQFVEELAKGVVHVVFAAAAADLGLPPALGAAAAGQLLGMTRTKEEGVVTLSIKAPGYVYCKFDLRITSSIPPRGQYRPRYGVQGITDSSLAMWCGDDVSPKVEQFSMEL
jgi:hypothetical protein